MTNTGNAPAGNRVGATGNLRPAAHGQFQLLPVALPRAADWNRRIAEWLAA